MKKTFNYITTTIAQHPSINQAGSMLGISIVISVINFIYNVFLGRNLEYVDLGIVAVMASILTFLQIPLSAYARTITHKAAYNSNKPKEYIRGLLLFFRKTSYFASIVLTIFWFMLIPFLMRFFSIPSALPFVLLAPLWGVSVTSAVNSAFLLGLHQFKAVGLISLLEMILYVGITFAAIQLGYPQFLYISTPISLFVTFLLSWTVVSKLLDIGNMSSITGSKIDSTKFPWKYYWNALVTKFSSTTFVTLDVLLVKHYLDPYSAGQYIILSVIGKMIFFSSTLLSQFVIPFTSRDVGKGTNPRKMFTVLFGLNALALGSVTLVFALYGDVLTPLIFGEKTKVITQFIPLYITGMACFGLSNMLVMYYQSKNEFITTLNSLLAIAIVFIGIFFNHESLEDVSRVMAFAGIFSLFFAISQRFLFNNTYFLYLAIGVSRILPSALLKKIIKNKHVLPKNIGDFTLLTPLNEHKNTEFTFGLYENNGKKVIAKVWQGKFRTESYWRLLAEINNLQSLNKITALLGFNHNFAIPQLVFSKTGQSRVEMVVEYIEKDKINEANTTDIVEAIKYFEELSNHIEIDKTFDLKKKNGFIIFMEYWLIAAAAIVAFPTKARIFLYASVQFLINSWVLIMQPANFIAHHDLHPQNILKHNGQRFIVDLGFAVKTVKMSDLVKSTILNWDSGEANSYLLTEINTRVSSKKGKALVKALGIYHSLLYLTDNTQAKTTLDGYFDALNFWSSYGKK